MGGDFNICSFNCEGIKRTSDYLSQFLNSSKCDIICLQEIWLLDSTIDYLNTLHSDYMYIGIAGQDSNDSILSGRPKGGVAILYNKILIRNIIRLKSINRRVCGVIINFTNNFTCMLLNVYFPCDNYSNTTVASDYIDYIEYIESLYNSHDCNAYIFCGDYNTSFERNNAHALYLSDFLSRNNLFLSWNHDSAVQDYTYVNHSLGHRSCIDHVILSENIFDCIISNKIICDPTNPSSHNIVQLTIKCFNSTVYSSSPQVHLDKSPKNAWRKALPLHREAYRYKLDELLSAIDQSDDLLYCRHINCNTITHRHDIDLLCKLIIDCCLCASATTINAF